MCLFVFSPLPLVSCSRVSSAFPVQKEMADNLLVLAQLTAVQSYLKFKNFDFFFFENFFSLRDILFTAVHKVYISRNFFSLFLFHVGILVIFLPHCVLI